MLRLIRLVLLGAVLLLASVAHGKADATLSAGANLAAPPVKVGVVLAPPFVMQTPAGYGGMAIDLWQNVADKLGLSYQYERLPTFRALLDAVAAGKVDIAVMDVTITQDRLQRMDFTQPWFDTGLRVMINQNRHAGIGPLLHQLWVSGHIRVYLWLVAIILLATTILTLIDRHYDDEFPRAWHQGLAESFYHVMSVATSGKTASHKALFGVGGRIMAALWMVCGVGVVAYITSSITSVMTASTITNQINSSADLPGKTVGVVSGSVGESFCLDAALWVQAYPTLAQAVKGLLKNQVAAVVDDASVLEYYDNTHPELPITEVGAIFRPSKYGFATPRGSALTRPVSVQIVAEEENGYLAHLKARYFGVEP